MMPLGGLCIGGRGLDLATAGPDDIPDYIKFSRQLGEVKFQISAQKSWQVKKRVISNYCKML